LDWFVDRWCPTIAQLAVCVFWLCSHALHLAAETGNVATLRYLVDECKLDVHEPNNVGLCSAFA
jgi:hypothetical protein